MANAKELSVLEQGVSRWNEWRKTKDGPSIDLSGADLRKRDLAGADLRAVNLSMAVLREARLGQGTLLWNANLSGADLYQADLRGASLQDADFTGADLFQADLRESNLQGANLSAAKGGLLSRQLAGSDLTGARLPEPLARLYEGLSSVKEISDNAQKLFLALLAGCLYSWLTIAQTTDVELITNRATSPLPIVQAAIPIVGFYVIGPLIVLCLYFYFHFYLQKLWEELGSLPAIFTDGRPLHNRTDPWLLNDLVRSHFLKLKDGRPFLSYFQVWVSVLLAWWLVPITLFLFWMRYLRRHDLYGTLFHALIMTCAILSAVWLYRIANGTLRGEERPVFQWKETLKRRSTYLRFALVMALGAFLIVITLGIIFGTKQPPGESPRAWLPWLLDRAGYSPFASLRDADVSVKPPNWTGKKDEELDLVKGANLAGSNLRHADARDAFFARANLKGAYMEDAVLVYADLRQANLESAHLDRAWLFFARLQGASMDHAHMEQVTLPFSHLDRAHLDFAHLEDALLNQAQLTGASLCSADLSNAVLSGAKLSGAVDLFDANLSGASLIDADLQGADLEYAKLRGADLTGARLDAAELRYADFRSLEQRPTLGLTPELLVSGSQDWEFAFYDPGDLKKLHLPADHNETLQKQMEAEQAKNAAPKPAAAKPGGATSARSGCKITER